MYHCTLFSETPCTVEFTYRTGLDIYAIYRITMNSYFLVNFEEKNLFYFTKTYYFKNNLKSFDLEKFYKSKILILCLKKSLVTITD